MNNINRGKLNIFTSYTPGAGKSYLMVETAVLQKEEGRTVVIGFLNSTHRDIDRILKDHQIRRTFGKKYSLKKILELQPDVVVMDEMGMSGQNKDGKSFVYEDIEVLLKRGIDVYTSANLKRFQGMNPKFKEITGIGIRKTIPDLFLKLADKIYFVDRSPEQMILGFQSGCLFDEKYMESKIMKKNFQLENLRAYRSLSLELLNDQYAEKLEIFENKFN